MLYKVDIVQTPTTNNNEIWSIYVWHYIVQIKQSSSRLLDDITERITLFVHLNVWDIATIHAQT